MKNPNHLILSHLISAGLKKVAEVQHENQFTRDSVAVQQCNRCLGFIAGMYLRGDIDGIELVDEIDNVCNTFDLNWLSDSAYYDIIEL